MITVLGKTDLKKIFRGIFPGIIHRISETDLLLSARHNVKVLVTRVGSRELRIVSPIYKKSDEMVLYLHGGDHVRYSSKKRCKLVSVIAERTGAVVLVPDLWSNPVMEQQEAIDFLGDIYSIYFQGLENRKIIFIGDSAAGELTLAYSQKLRDDKVKQPSGIMLLSPLPGGAGNNPEIVSQSPGELFPGRDLRIFSTAQADDTKHRTSRIKTEWADLLDWLASPFLRIRMIGMSLR